MAFFEDFPLRYYINLARREDRRVECEFHFEERNLSVERFPGIDARFVRYMSLERDKQLSNPTGLVRGYENASRYALALSQRMAVRSAKRKGASSVILFEDDVVLHPNFLSLFEGIELPADWGLLYFGCTHLEQPSFVSDGLVRANKAIDTHAFAVRELYYDRVVSALNAYGKQSPDHPLASDRFLAALQQEIPTYACFPNLAWQRQSPSDIAGVTYSNYTSAGLQAGLMDETKALLRSVRHPVGGAKSVVRTVKVGLLFLSRESLNHEEIWREYIEQAPDSVRIFAHSKSVSQSNCLLSQHQIQKKIDTAWGDISLVRATLALLNEALEDQSITHFVLLSESCVPIKPLKALLRQLRVSKNSRFCFHGASAASAIQRDRMLAVREIPSEGWCFQSQWWIMERFAAEWAVAADYSNQFARMVAPDEVYFATVLRMLGFPLEDFVVNAPSTWLKWLSGKGSPEEFEEVTPSLAAEIAESGAFFGRKFSTASNIGEFGFHLD